MLRQWVSFNCTDQQWIVSLLMNNIESIASGMS